MSTHPDVIIRREAILNSAVEQIRALLETNFAAIGKAADDLFERIAHERARRDALGRFKRQRNQKDMT